MSYSNSNTPDHEKIFNDICNKLNELSHRNQEELAIMEENQVAPQADKIEAMQDKIKKFQNEMQGNQEELMSKIKSLEQVQFSTADLNVHLKQLTEQLNSERAINSKLNADLAKSLELCLQLQLEIQGLKARSMQAQSEEKRYSQAVLEKNKSLARELELAQALKEETAVELSKAKSLFQREQELWEETRVELEKRMESLIAEKQEVLNANEGLLEALRNKDFQIAELNERVEEINRSFTEVEGTAQQQSDALKNLMNVAENKIVEMKLALDKKTAEAQDYYSHLQQTLAQANVLRQENVNLKDYVAKLNYYLQQQNQAQAMVQAQAQAQSQALGTVAGGVG